MGQKYGADRIGLLSHNAGVITLAAGSRLTIAGQQYSLLANLTRTIATDVTTVAATPYYIYAVIQGIAVELRVSANVPSVGPAGFTNFKLVGSFLTAPGSGAFAAFNSPDFATGEVTQSNLSPVGMVVASALTQAQFQALNGPSWVLCAGQSVVGSAYAAVTGVTTTPDLRGRTIAGVDNMGGSAANRVTPGGSGITGTTLGAAGGAETHTLTTAQLAVHTHTQNTHGHTVAVYNDSAANGAVPGGRNPGAGVSGNPAVADTIATNQNAGSGSAHLNTQPTMMLNYFMKINY